jgi:hypothetical protein
MSNILDRVFNEVCLDERVTDGIFKMDDATHMDALREYFVKKGVTREAAIAVTNRMVEGKYPERQAYNKDGILVTFPTPQHKARAIARGTHFEKNPVPQVQQAKAEEPEPKKAPPGSKPEPGELPPDEDDDEKDDKDDEEDDEKGGGGSHGGGKEPTIFQGDKQLAVEPPRGEEIPEPPPQPPAPTIPPAPHTPQRAAAEKEIARQILSTDDTTLSNVSNPVNVSEETRRQLQELFKKADEMGYREAIKFLSHYVKP